MAVFQRRTQPMTDDEMDGQAVRSQMRTTPPTAVPPQGTPGGIPEYIAQPDKGMPTVKPDSPAPPPAASPYGDFNTSAYGTSSGLAQAAAKYLQPQVQAAKSEQEAKSIVQNFMQSLAPEFEKRGSKFGGAKNEAITLDGREYDMFRDIGGASEAQMTELGLGGGGGGAQSAARAMGMAPPAAGTSIGGVESLMPTDQNATAEMMARLKAILGGDEAFDRAALLQQMQR